MKNCWLHYVFLALVYTVVSPALAQDVSATGKPLASVPDTTDSNGNTALVRIDRFVVKGNTLLSPVLIERTLNPFKGNDRSFTDIQLALEALEGLYRSAGYSAVHVVTPEQEVAEGTITFEVEETVIGKVVLKGNEHYDKKNIRNALPSLVEGTTPNARLLSQNIRLANENPTRQIDVVLALGEEENTVDAQVNVQDSSPHKFFVTLDNTGTASTGKYRTGVGYQHNNMFNRDQSLTLNYITSPNHLTDVKQYSASYRIPIYSRGDSVDLLAAYSDTNVGSTSVAGPGNSSLLSFSGTGDVFGAHYNHYFPRHGDYTSKIVSGVDSRITRANCLSNGTALSTQGCTDINLLPFTLTFGGTLTKPTFITDYSASAVHNLPYGSKGGASAFGVYPGVPDAYSILHLNGSVSGVLPKDWQYRVAGNAQYADALIASEKLGLAGANAVRGFLERQYSNDRGYIVNLELYTPELAQYFKLREGSLRFLGFIDNAGGWDRVVNSSGTAKRTKLGSVGVGFRYNSGKHLTVKFDFSKVECSDNDGQTCAQNSSSIDSSRTGNTRGQISVLANW